MQAVTGAAAESTAVSDDKDRQAPKRPDYIAEALEKMIIRGYQHL